MIKMKRCKVFMYVLFLKEQTEIQIVFVLSLTAAGAPGRTARSVATELNNSYDCVKTPGRRAICIQNDEGLELLLSHTY